MSCFFVSVRSLAFFVKQKSTVGFGRHQLSRRLRPANIKVSRFGSWFSPRILLVFKKRGFPATVPVASPAREVSGDVHVGPRPEVDLRAGFGFMGKVGTASGGATEPDNVRGRSAWSQRACVPAQSV